MLKKACSHIISEKFEKTNEVLKDLRHPSDRGHGPPSQCFSTFRVLGVFRSLGALSALGTIGGLHFF